MHLIEVTRKLCRQTDNIIRLQRTDVQVFIGLNTKVPHKNNPAALKTESQPFFNLISRVDGQIHRLCPRTRSNFSVVQAYQFRPGERQSDGGSPPTTTNQLAAHLLHRHIKKQQRASKHSCTSEPHHAKSEPGSGVRLGGGMVPTCNIKDNTPSLQASVRVQPQSAHYPPPLLLKAMGTRVVKGGVCQV